MADAFPIDRRTFLIASAACASGAAPASDEPGMEGRWLATLGPPDNRARIGLEVARAPDGGLQASYTIDLLSFYGAALPALERLGPGRWGIRRYGLSFAMAGSGLEVVGLVDEPIRMQRVAELPEAPPATPVPRGPDPAWQLGLGGPIFAPAAVLGHHVYVGNTDGVMHAVDLRSAQVTWSFAAGRAIHGEATVTPDAVFFACDNGWLYRLDRATGQEAWRYDLDDGRIARVLPNPFVFDYDHAAPRPALHDGTLYLGAGDGGFHAVDAATGARRWRFQAKGKVRSSAAVHDGWVVFGTLDGVLYGLDRDTGQERWQFDTGGAVTSTPVFAAGRVVVGNRGSVLQALEPGRPESLWRQPWWGSWVESTAVIADGEAYIGSGDLFRVAAFDPATGRNRWRAFVGGWVLQRPAVAGARVYASVSGARRRAKHFMPQQAGLTAIDRANGRVAWHWPAPSVPGAFLHGMVGAPCVVPGFIVAGGLDGMLRGFVDAT